MDSSFTFRIPADILEQLRVLAEEQDVSIAQLFRKMAREYVTNNKTNKV